MLLKIIFSFFTFLLVTCLTIAWYGFTWTENVYMVKNLDSYLKNKDFFIINNEFKYDPLAIKIMMHSARKPQIISIGSSRVLQFRDYFFTKKFVNWGYTVGSIPRLETVANALKKLHRADIIILGVDHWWFSRAYTCNPYEKENIPEFDVLKKIKHPFGMLRRGQMSKDDLFILKSSKPQIVFDDMESVEGIGADGSYYYNAIVTGSKKHDIKFMHTLGRIEQLTAPFYIEKKLSNTHVASFVQNINKLKSVCDTLIIFIPPLAQTIYDEMKEYEQFYPHLFMLKQELKNKGIAVIDYSDMKTFSSNDCEAIDGFHGGDVAYARVLLDIGQRYPELISYINVDYLKTIVKITQDAR